MTTWPAFMRERRLSLLAIAFTLAALLAVTIRADFDAEWLRDYTLTPQRLQALYIMILAVLAGVFAFEPNLRRELSDGKATALITGLALFASFFVVWIIVPDQQERWSRFPLTIWFIIAHVVGLCAIVVRMALQYPDDEPTFRMARYARIITFSLGLLLLYVHITSVGSFMRFDMPDEPWSASAATNFAASGQLNRSYNGGAYGDKDPTEARYYVLMGLWVRALGPDFVTMRAFSLVVAG
ncbi:MAG: hypothetical protein H7175_08755, partial [Burkholderiales bacterium]|nr:hypothetical protein [Anaerolineae bacterium]